VRRRRRQSNGGFTLIEMLVVIIIIAVVAGVLVPNYTRMAAKANFDGTVAEVEALFAYAHEEAILRDTTVALSYDAQREQFSVSSAPIPPSTDLPAVMMSPDSRQSLQPVPPQTVELSMQYAVGDFAIGSGNGNTEQSGGGNMRGINGPTIRFRGDGACDGAEVVLISRDGYSADLKVMPANGRIVRDDNGNGRR
jgi:prepilin-type N-terminal cleavage/methylation domain-containing protein